MSEKDKYKKLVESYVLPHKKYIFVLVFFILIGSSITGITPYIYGKMIDAITVGNIGLLKIFIVTYFGINLISNILSIIEIYVGQTTNFKLTANMQKDLFGSIIRMKSGAYSTYETGELMSRLNGDSDSIVGFSINFVTDILHIAINLVISVYFVITISLMLSTVSLFYVPTSFLLTILIRRHFRKLTEKQKKFGDAFYSFQSEVFRNNSGIKSFNLQNKMDEKYHLLINRQFGLLKHSIKLSSINQFMSSMIMVISSLFIIYVSALFIKNGVLTIGLMVAFSTYINKLFSAVSQVFSLNISIQSVLVSVNRVYDMLSEDIEMDSVELGKVEDINYNVSFRNIFFAYPGTEEIVLNDISLEISENGFYSIVGPNGCGKSTLSKLLTRFYDSLEGEICLGGQKITNLSYTELRKQITYVQKEEFFLNDTVMNNLKIGDEMLLDEDVIRCCKKIGIDAFIENLPKKYQSPMGESGSMFSSGQKQKLSIARALLRKSQVYIFDELTSNIDGNAEREIMEILHDLSQHAIVIFISHSVASIKESKVIFLVVDGKIMDFGTHGHLLYKNMLYRRLFNESASVLKR